MTTSVVVVAHRLHEWLVPSLASVADQCDELIVVDSGSAESAVGMAARPIAPMIVRLERNTGFAGGVNAGVEKATGDVVALLNDDAFADRGWLKSAAAVLADESIAAVGPKLVVDRRYARVLVSDPPHFDGADPRPLGRCVMSALAGDVDVLPRLVGSGIHEIEHGIRGGGPTRWRWTAGDPEPIFLPLDPDVDPGALVVNGEPVAVSDPIDLVNSAGTFLTRRGFGGDIGYLAPDAGQFDEAGDRFATCGAALVTTQRALHRIGTFAGHFFAYYEDLDWCWRAQLAGLRIRYDPTATVRHVGGATSGGPDSLRVRGLAARNRFLTLARNAPLGVLAEQLRQFREDPEVSILARSLARRLPPALVRERRALSKGWTRSPAEVWRQWAGVYEHWSGNAESAGNEASER
jgi:GT2 family glycosyltransferase